MKRRVLKTVVGLILCILIIGGVKIEAKNKVTFDIKEYNYERGTGKKIEVTGLNDSKKQALINKILEEDSKAVLAPYDLNDKNVSVTMNVEYKYQQKRNRLVVTYKGVYINKTAAHPTAYYAISIVDLDKAIRSQSPNKLNKNAIIDAILKGKYKVIAENKELENAQKNYISTLTKNDLTSLFKKFNFYKADNKVIKPDVFILDNEDSITVILPTFHALGDYAVIVISNKDLE